MKTRIAILFGLFLLTACGHLSEDRSTLVFRTADPALSIGLALLPAPPIPTIEPQLLPTVTPTPEPCLIAGNINSQGRKLYHTPDSPQYGQVRIDEAKGERWFCSPEEAEAAGWTRAGGG